MSVRYSYDDFTTKGHGVIEGYAGNNHIKYTGKKIVKKKKPKLEIDQTYSKKNHKKNIDDTYSKLMNINRASRYKNTQDNI